MAEPDIATVDEIYAAGEQDFEIPGLGKKIRCRKVSGSEYATTLPADPQESLAWPTDVEARREAHRKWIEAQPEEVIDRRRQSFADADYKLIALAAVSPRLTVDEARRLGQAAMVIAAQLLAWSLPVKSDTAAPSA